MRLVRLGLGDRRFLGFLGFLLLFRGGSGAGLFSGFRYQPGALVRLASRLFGLALIGAEQCHGIYLQVEE